MGRMAPSGNTNGLEARGWRIVAELSGDDYRVSATWEIERSTQRPSVFIDFDRLDDLITLPLEQSYGCCIRGIIRPTSTLVARAKADRDGGRIGRLILSSFSTTRPN
jgi:hypothetical protein